MKTLDHNYNFLKPINTNDLIRIGRNQDGGYVVNSKIIEKCNILISFGLGSDWSFELDYLKKNKNLKIYVYDHTVSYVPYIKETLKYLKRFLLLKKNFHDFYCRFLNLYSYLKFKKNKQVNFFSEKITFPIKEVYETDINKVFSRIEAEKEVILKCDIEGSEFLIIDQILEHSNRINLLIFEFHNLDKYEDNFKKLINKLSKKFKITHIHGNNHDDVLPSGLPITIELTMVNFKYCAQEAAGNTKNYPLANLDFPNNPHKKDISFCFKE
jgi:hypothetical protein|tara:strand:+ start:412 stop:1218 length:807 start_codon:yes stop_codon:yes gene_type:complete